MKTSCIFLDSIKISRGVTHALRSPFIVSEGRRKQIKIKKKRRRVQREFCLAAGSIFASTTSAFVLYIYFFFTTYITKHLYQRHSSEMERRKRSGYFFWRPAALHRVLGRLLGQAKKMTPRWSWDRRHTARHVLLGSSSFFASLSPLTLFNAALVSFPIYPPYSPCISCLLFVVYFLIVLLPLWLAVRLDKPRLNWTFSCMQSSLFFWESSP